jgi:hypothetical protein
VNPYKDINNTRTFSKDVLTEELVWHRDKEDRTVTILEGVGWKFQKDNELPIHLNVGDEVAIKAFEYHRIIKGKTDLKIEIKEN